MNDGSPQEAWNMATATMKRLDRILTFCSFHAQNDDLKNWFNCILDLRRNLIPFLEQEELTKISTKLETLPAGWNSSTRTKPVHYGKVSQVLDETYIILYCCMKNKGLLMPKNIDVRKSIIEM